MLAVIRIGAAYFGFATRKIRQECVSRLEEVYTQIDSAFRATVTKNWRLLHGWRGYISSAADENPREPAAFIQEEKEAWHFAHFYFLSEDGSDITDTGDTGCLDLGGEPER